MENATDLRLIFVSAPHNEAETLARNLVEQGLAACVQIIPKTHSIYRWQNEIVSDQESLLVMKTSADQLAALEAAIRQAHSYQVPEILAVTVESAHPAYRSWLLANVGTGVFHEKDGSSAPMFSQATDIYNNILNEIDKAGLRKLERVITSPQGARIQLDSGAEVLNFCANNYLGLSNHPAILQAAHETLDRYGYGLSSVRFICGTQFIHTELEAEISRFFGTEATILYSSCFDANGGLFETLLGEEDAIISDALNHASIIDGIRLSKAVRYRYANGDMAMLETQLKEAQKHRIRLIATDGVFSMDGYFAKLDTICDLAEKYQALVMVDDSHATGFIGARGRGTPEKAQVLHRIDIMTSTLGKALGGASGGFTTGRKALIDLLRQRSRPYLFSNTLAPVICGTSLAVLKLLDKSDDLRKKLAQNTQLFRQEMTQLGFEIPKSDHPIVPVMVRDARLATEMADALLKHGVYVIGFSYPVVPKDAARIRVQLSAAHQTQDIEQALAAFQKIGKQFGVIR